MTGRRIDLMEAALTFEAHVAGVTVELLVSYSDFSACFRSSKVRLTVNTLRSRTKKKEKD